MESGEEESADAACAIEGTAEVGAPSVGAEEGVFAAAGAFAEDVPAALLVDEVELVMELPASAAGAVPDVFLNAASHEVVGEDEFAPSWQRDCCLGLHSKIESNYV